MHQLSSEPFLQFSGNNSYYSGDDNVTNLLTAFECGEYWQPQIICGVFTRKAGLRFYR